MPKDVGLAYVPDGSDEASAPRVNEFGVMESNMPQKQGFLTTKHQGSAGNFKITHYDFNKLVRVSALATVLCKGTVFNLDSAIHFAMLAYTLVFAMAWSGLYMLGDPERFEVQSLPVILEISYDLQRFCPFVFGLFTSIMLQRWWAMRTDALGAIGDHCINVSGILASVAARVLVSTDDWEAFKLYHGRVVKYGLASMSCIVMESRRIDAMKGCDETTHEAHRLEKLTQLGLLTEFERSLLEKSNCTATCLWSWIQALSVEALEAMKVPPPNVNMLYQEVRHGMAGIHHAHQYLSSQMPFPYVHMITLLVNVNSLVICVVAGVQCAVGSSRGEIAVCVCNFIKIYMLPVLFQALLQICVFLSDPFGDDIIDFPIRQFQKDVSQACEDHLFLRDLYENRWLNKESLPPKLTFMKELRQPPQADPEATVVMKPEVTPEAKGEAGMQQAIGKLDQRLEALAENALTLTQNMTSLQEMLNQTSNVMALSVGNLQTQVKELTSGLSTAVELRLPSRQLPLAFQNPRPQPGRMQDPLACCAVQTSSGPEAISASS